jgi:hypothetical protein
MANFGTVGVDWQQRVNWDRLRKYRLERARERMKAHGLGALLLMYDENVRYVTSTLTPGWNRLKPGLRYALLCGDGAPVLFEQGTSAYDQSSLPLDPARQRPLCLLVDQRSRGRGFTPTSEKIHQRNR